MGRSISESPLSGIGGCSLHVSDGEGLFGISNETLRNRGLSEDMSSGASAVN